MDTIINEILGMPPTDQASRHKFLTLLGFEKTEWIEDGEVMSEHVMNFRAPHLNGIRVEVGDRTISVWTNTTESERREKIMISMAYTSHRVSRIVEAMAILNSI